MNAFQSYAVQFVAGNDPKPRTQNFRAASPAHAYQKCLQKNPDVAKFLGAFLEGKMAGGNFGSISYPGVSTARVEAEPVPETKETTFPFWDSCLGQRRLP
jgi:hypothetical protein